MKKYPAFSLIEVLFAIAFLVMVGVAMVSLNAAASVVSEATELKQIGLSLNEQSLSFIALEKRTRSDFATAYSLPSPGIDCIGNSNGCYVVCPPDTSQICTLQTARAAIQVGTNKLQFAQTIKIQLEVGSTDRYLVNATSSWGNGTRQKVTTARILE